MARTAFGKEAMKKLIDMEQNQEWLCQQVRERTGMFCDQAYISRIFTGERNAPKIVTAIREILDIPEEGSG